MTNHRKSILN